MSQVFRNNQVVRSGVKSNFEKDYQNNLISRIFMGYQNGQGVKNGLGSRADRENQDNLNRSERNYENSFENSFEKQFEYINLDGRSSNPWNEFQRKNKGKYDKEELRIEYEKSRINSKIQNSKQVINQNNRFQRK